MLRRRAGRRARGVERAPAPCPASATRRGTSTWRGTDAGPSAGRAASPPRCPRAGSRSTASANGSRGCKSWSMTIAAAAVRPPRRSRRPSPPRPGGVRPPRRPKSGTPNPAGSSPRPPGTARATPAGTSTASASGAEVVVDEQVVVLVLGHGEAVGLLACPRRRGGDQPVVVPSLFTRKAGAARSSTVGVRSVATSMPDPVPRAGGPAAVVDQLGRRGRWRAGRRAEVSRAGRCGCLVADWWTGRLSRAEISWAEVVGHREQLGRSPPRRTTYCSPVSSGREEAALVATARGGAEEEPRDRGSGEEEDGQGDAADQRAAGLEGSTSRPPGAPETNAVTSRRRLNE